MTTSHNQPGVFAFTRGKLFIVVSLIFTWWFAHLLPQYQSVIVEQVAQVSSRLQEAQQKIPAIKVDWKVPNEPRADFNASKVALIIEPRPLPHLVPLLLHMVSVVPPDWRFVFIGSEKSVYSLNRAYAIKNQQVIGKLDLLVLPEPWDISSKEMVFRLLTDLRFYDEFLPGVEWILKYESDSILCANSPKSLNDWLDWAWAGAPRNPDDRFSGNGGLSLRKVSAIRRVLNFQARYNDSEPEDEWFGRRLWIMPGEKVTSGLTALAVEGVYIEKPMGFHIADSGRKLPDSVFKNKEQRKKIFEYCPELSLIVDMKLERERCKGDKGNGDYDPAADIAKSKASAASVASVSSVSKAKAEASEKAKIESSKAAAAAKATAESEKKPDGEAKPGAAKEAEKPKETSAPKVEPVASQKEEPSTEDEEDDAP